MYGADLEGAESSREDSYTVLQIQEEQSIYGVDIVQGEYWLSLSRLVSQSIPSQEGIVCIDFEG